MQVEQVKTEELKRELKVTVEGSTVNGQIDARLLEAAATLKVPGFRPGKVPPNIIRKHHGKRVIGEVLESVIQQTSQQALNNENLRPALQPEIEILDFKEGEDLIYKMEFEILPDVPDVNLTDIEIDKYVCEVGPKQIEESIENILQEHKHFNPVKDDRAAKKGDVVVIDFKGFTDGVAFEGGESTNFRLELGSGMFVEGFEDQLIGTKAGEDKKVEITFPKNYQTESLAGRDAYFEVKVHEILEVERHEKADDELAEHLGYDSLNKLKEAIQQQLEREVAIAVRAHTKRQLFDILDDKYKFPVPEQMIDMEYKAVWDQVQQMNASNPQAETSEEGLKQECNAMAERRVRLGLLLSDVANKNQINVTPEELSRAVVRAASNHPGQEQDIYNHYQDHPEQMEAFRGPLLEEKSVDFILEKVKLKEKKLTIEELQALEDEAID